MVDLFVIIWLISAICTGVYGFKWFKKRKEIGIKKEKNIFLVCLIISFISFVSIGIVAPPTESTNNDIVMKEKSSESIVNTNDNNIIEEKKFETISNNNDIINKEAISDTKSEEEKTIEEIAEELFVEENNIDEIKNIEQSKTETKKEDKTSPIVTNPDTNKEKEIKPTTTTQENNNNNNVKTSTYILNTNSKKFHKPNCSSVKKMSEKNKKTFTGTRDDVINQNYQPCKNCNP